MYECICMPNMNLNGLISSKACRPESSSGEMIIIFIMIANCNRMIELFNLPIVFQSSEFSMEHDSNWQLIYTISLRSVLSLTEWSCVFYFEVQKQIETFLLISNRFRRLIGFGIVYPFVENISSLVIKWPHVSCNFYCI